MRRQTINGSFTDVIERAGEEVEVMVGYTYFPGTPDVMYLPNGDPGHPGDPPQFEITACTDWQGNNRMGDLTEEELERFKRYGLDELDFYPVDVRY